MSPNTEVKTMILTELFIVFDRTNFFCGRTLQTKEYEASRAIPIQLEHNKLNYPTAIVCSSAA